jgi:hypothetical protein
MGNLQQPGNGTSLRDRPLPEPAALSLLTLSGIALLRRKRRVR